jgi:hypothetical protein
MYTLFRKVVSTSTSDHKMSNSSLIFSGKIRKPLKVGNFQSEMKLHIEWIYFVT